MGECKCHDNIDLFTLQMKYRKKIIKPPTWQRGDAWKKKKKKEFRDAVIEKAEKGMDILTGCVITYRLPDDPNNEWISDGQQRAINAGIIYDELVKKHGEDYAMEMLSRIRVPRLVMEYKDETEAKYEFLLVNQGTPLSKKDKAKPILTTLPDFESWNQRILLPLHQIVSEAIAAAGIKNSEKSTYQDLRERDNYALFVRYLSGDKSMTDYDKEVRTNSDKVLEQRLVNELKPLGIDAADNKLKAFKKFLNEQVSYIKQIWDSIPKKGWDPSIQTPTHGCMRCLMLLCIYKRNNSIPQQRVSKFIEHFLGNTHGKTHYIRDNGNKTVLAIGRITPFRMIQNSSGIYIDPTLDPTLTRMHKSTSQLHPGVHNAHVTSFALSDGDSGELVPLPGPINHSMGTASLDS